MYVDRISINVFKEHINLLKNKLAHRIQTHYLAIMCLLISNELNFWQPINVIYGNLNGPIIEVGLGRNTKYYKNNTVKYLKGTVEELYSKNKMKTKKKWKFI